MTCRSHHRLPTDCISCVILCKACVCTASACRFSHLLGRSTYCVSGDQINYAQDSPPKIVLFSVADTDFVCAFSKAPAVLHLPGILILFLVCDCKVSTRGHELWYCYCSSISLIMCILQMNIGLYAVDCYLYTVQCVYRNEVNCCKLRTMSHLHPQHWLSIHAASEQLAASIQ